MPIFSQSRDFVTKNGIVTEGTGVATSSTGGSNIIQSGGGLAAAGNLVVGTSATVYGEMVVLGTTSTFQNLRVNVITATQTATFLDIVVGNINATGTVSGTITGNIATATNLANGAAGQIPFQSSPGQTSFIGGSGTGGDLLISNGSSAPSFKNTLTLTGSTLATNTNTGALVVQGGVGIWGNLYVGGNLSAATVVGTSTNAITATNVSAGTAGQIVFQTAPGVTSYAGPGTSEDILVSRGTTGPVFQNTLTLGGSTPSSSTSTGALKVTGGVGIGQNIYVGGTANVGGIASFTNTTESTTSATGAVTVSGGLGVSKNLNVGGDLTLVGQFVASKFILSGNNLDTQQTTFNLANTTATTINLGGAATSIAIGSISGTTNIKNQVTITTSTAATNATSGALVVTGGVGISGALYVTGAINGNLTGTATSANNLTGGAAGSIPIQSASGTTAYIPIGVSGYILSVTAGNTATWVSTAGLSAGQATTSSNLASGTAGQVPYQSAAGVTQFYGPGSEGEIVISRSTTGPTYANTLTLGGSTQATNSYTGALQVRGGVGIVKDLFVGGSGNYVGNVTIESSGASTATGSTNALFVKGGAYIQKTLTVKDDARFEGSVIFAGTATYVYSTNTVVTDNLINLHVPPGSTGSNHTWTLDDGKDIGHIFHYYKSGQDKDAFLGLANDTAYLEWYDNGTEAGGVFTGTSYGIFKTGGIRLVGGTANNGDSTSGDLQVTGGVGIGGRLYVGSTTTFNASIIPSSSGVNLGSPSLRFGSLYVTSSTIDISGVPLGSDGGNYIFAPAARFTATTVASSTSTGALIVNGGAGIAGAVYIGGETAINSGVTSTSPTTGALTVAGGAGIGGNLNISGTAAFGSTSSSAVVMGWVSNNSAYATYTSPGITNTVQQVLDTFSTSTYRTAKYLIQLVDGPKYHAQEMLLFHDNSQVYKTEYAVIFNTAELGTFDVDISSGNARLLFTAAAGVSSLVAKLTRTTITT